MTNRALRKQIREASFEEILRLWRFSPIGSPVFEGPVGDLLTARYAAMRSSLSDAEWTALSKRVGWDNLPNHTH